MSFNLPFQVHGYNNNLKIDVVFACYDRPACNIHGRSFLTIINAYFQNKWNTLTLNTKKYGANHCRKRWNVGWRWRQITGSFRKGREVRREQFECAISPPVPSGLLVDGDSSRKIYMSVLRNIATYNSNSNNRRFVSLYITVYIHLILTSSRNNFIAMDEMFIDSLRTT